MMRETWYYPLIDGDSDGSDKFPLFPTEDRAGAAGAYGYYLEEMIPRSYTLCRGGRKKGPEDGAFLVHCPRCGKVMDRIQPGKRNKGNEQRPMYMCRACSKERKV